MLVDAYLLSLTPAQLDVISKSLMGSPYGLVFPIINSINSQIDKINGEALARQAIKTSPVTEPAAVEPSPTVIATPEATD